MYIFGGEACRSCSSLSSLDENETFDDERETQITLRAGVGGVVAGEEIFHDYADHASGGALLEFGFVYHGERARGIGSHALDVSLTSAYETAEEKTRAFLDGVFERFGVRRSAIRCFMHFFAAEM